MDVSDSAVGKAVLISTGTAFLIIILWVNTYPFLDEDSVIVQYVPDPKWFLTLSAAWGALFIGGLIAFTVYHLYPYS